MQPNVVDLRYIKPWILFDQIIFINYTKWTFYISHISDLKMSPVHVMRDNFSVCTIFNSVKGGIIKTTVNLSSSPIHNSTLESFGCTKLWNKYSCFDIWKLIIFMGGFSIKVKVSREPLWISLHGGHFKLRLQYL